MRMIYGFILVVLLGAVGLFVLQNRDEVTLKYLDRTVTTTVAVLIGATYGSA